MKRLVVCSDGTWSAPDSGDPTNVRRFEQAVVEPSASDGVRQEVFYDAGVGTGGGWLVRLSGGIAGTGLGKNIRDCYQFLVENYEAGDEVYLLGYSRGAYTVRSLAGMIYNAGLLPVARADKIDEAYALYRDRNRAPSSPDAIAFRRENNSPQIEIALVACWDTVGSLGIPPVIPWLPFDNLFNRRFQFHDTQVNRKIRYALHAVAIDEQREAFQVTHMNRSDGATTDISEVWFPGVHSSVGGGVRTTLGLSDMTLLWIAEAIATLPLGLELNLDAIVPNLSPNPTTPFGGATGIFAILRQFERDLTGSFDGIHQSARERWRELPDYRPPNLAQRFESELNAWAREHPRPS